MVIDPSVFMRAAATPEAEVPVKRQRINRDDRPFSPPDLLVEVRPYDYGLVDKLYGFFQAMRNDRSREATFLDFREERHRLRQTERELAKTGPKPAYAPKVRASEIKECARKTTFRLLRFSERPIGTDSPQWSIAAQFGDNIHEIVGDALLYLGLSKRAEFDIENQLISGRVDHLLDGAVLDIKTVGEKDFKEKAWGDKVPGYIAQVSAYCRALEQPLGVVLLVNRNSGELFDFCWDVSSGLGAVQELRAATILGNVANRQLPSAEFFERGRPSFKCRLFCPFLGHCERQEATGDVQAALDKGADPKKLLMP